MREFLRLLLRWAIGAGGVAVAAWALPGISVSGDHPVWTLLLVALVLGLVNAIIRPILSLLSCGCIVLTLGLFMLVINGLMLWLAEYIAQNWLGLGFSVDGFWSAVFGAIIISVFSFLVSLLPGARKKG